MNSSRRVEIKCSYCGKSFLGRKERKYCSHSCSSEDRKKNNSSDASWPRTIKRIIIERDGWRCSICDITEWRSREVPLVLDHINGNSEDNTGENLRLVCPNCDAQLPTFKSRNTGKGRARRRERYNEGKSY